MLLQIMHCDQTQLSKVTGMNALNELCDAHLEGEMFSTQVLPTAHPLRLFLLLHRIYNKKIYITDCRFLNFMQTENRINIWLADLSRGSSI